MQRQKNPHCKTKEKNPSLKATPKNPKTAGKKGAKKDRLTPC